MFIDDYIEKITLQEEVKNLKSMNETLASENLELNDQNTLLRNTLISRKYEIDGLKYAISVLKKNAAECKLHLKEKDENDEEFLKYRLSNKEGKIKELEAKIEMLEKDRKDSIEACRDCILHPWINDVSESTAENQKLRDQNEGLMNKVKSLEDEVRHLQWEKEYLANQVEHLQSCLDLEKNKD